MKAEKFFFNTNEVLLDKFRTKRRLREDLVTKVSKYDLEISEIQNELIKRGMSVQDITKP